MSVEFQVFVMISIQVIMQWIVIGNDFLNYYLDYGYFNQLQQLKQLERGERNNAN